MAKVIKNRRSSGKNDRSRSRSRSPEPPPLNKMYADASGMPQDLRALFTTFNEAAIGFASGECQLGELALNVLDAREQGLKLLRMLYDFKKLDMQHGNSTTIDKMITACEAFTAGLLIEFNKLQELPKSIRKMIREGMIPSPFES